MIYKVSVYNGDVKLEKMPKFGNLMFVERARALATALIAAADFAEGKPPKFTPIEV